MKPNCDCLNECGDDTSVAKGEVTPCEYYPRMMRVQRLSSLRREANFQLLVRAEAFIAGFEHDPSQEGVPALLADLRQIINYVNGTQGVTA